MATLIKLKDTFTDADNTTLLTHTPETGTVNPVLNNSDGTKFQINVTYPDTKIVNNRLVIDTAENTYGGFWAVIPKMRYGNYVQARIYQNGASSKFRVVLGLNESASGSDMCDIDGATNTIYFSNKTISHTVLSGALYRLERIGNVVTLYENGVVVDTDTGGTLVDASGTYPRTSLRFARYTEVDDYEFGIITKPLTPLVNQWGFYSDVAPWYTCSDSNGVYMIGGESDGVTMWLKGLDAITNTVDFEVWDAVTSGVQGYTSGMALGSDALYIIYGKDIGGSTYNDTIAEIEKRSRVDGSLVWSLDIRNYPSAQTGVESLTDIKVDNNGIYVCGHTIDPINSAQIAVTRIEMRSKTDGSVIWTQSTTGITVSTVTSVIANGNGWRDWYYKKLLVKGNYLYALGWIQEIESGTLANACVGMFFEKRNLSDGSLVGSRVTIPTDTTFSDFMNMTVDANDNIYITYYDSNWVTYLGKWSITTGTNIWRDVTGYNGGSWYYVTTDDTYLYLDDINWSDPSGLGTVHITKLDLDGNFILDTIIDPFPISGGRAGYVNVASMEIVNGSLVVSGAVDENYTTDVKTYMVSSILTSNGAATTIPPESGTYVTIITENHSTKSHIIYNGVNYDHARFYVPTGSDVVLTFSPLSGYTITKVMNGSTDITSQLTGNPTGDRILTLTNVQTGTYTFIPTETSSGGGGQGGGGGASSYTITASVNSSHGAKGTTSSLGASVVAAGSNKTYTFTPEALYEVKSVKVDNVQVATKVLSYTFTNISADHTIEVRFGVISETVCMDLFG